MPRHSTDRCSGTLRAKKKPGVYKRKAGVKPRVVAWKPSKSETPEDNIEMGTLALADCAEIADIQEQIDDGVERKYRTKRKALPPAAPTPTPPPV